MSLVSRRGAAFLLAAALSVGSFGACAAPFLRGNIGIHDPSTIIKCKDRYYVFGTGQGIVSKWSTDKVVWYAGPPVFASAPAWTTNAVPKFDGTFWAPDIIYAQGRYCLYYAVSSWGSQVSAIGLATNPTLDPTDPAYHWTDRGVVIQSGSGSAYNTIDPSVAWDATGNLWMAFGSYWNGIFLVQLDAVTGLRVAPNSPTYPLAYNSSIEASCLYYHAPYYYLFVNWGSCCSGVNSTYNIRVGRSTSVTGPYLDRKGVDMTRNGGSLFLEATGKFTGPGHVGILAENGETWFSYHYYDAGAWAPWYGAFGVADFDVAPLSWTADGWPAYTNDWSAVYRFADDARDENGQYYGLLRNGAAVVSDPLYGHVLALNGTNQYVQLPAGVANARTFSAIVNWQGGKPWQRIFDFGVSTERWLFLSPMDDTGVMHFAITTARSLSVQLIRAPIALPSNTWAHVAVTLDGSRGVLYLNGAPLATNNNMTLSPLEIRAQTNNLGRSVWPQDPYFNGRIARFRVESRALSAAEIGAPWPTIDAPAEGATYEPGAAIPFQGGATDFREWPLPASVLSWKVEYVAGSTTNVVLGPLTGVTNGVLNIPTNVTGNGVYRIALTATDGQNRQRTVSRTLTAGPSLQDWASFYPFTTGAQDASNHWNGSLLGGAYVVQDPTRGNVLNLGGSSQYVSVPGGAGGFQTFAAWVRWNGGNAWSRIFDFGTDTSRWVMLTPLDSDGRMQVAISNDRANFVQDIQAPGPLPTGVWTHVAVVFDGRQGILYTNGVAVGVNNSVNLFPSDVGATRAYFGRSQYPADPYFNGQIDSIQLNSRPLTLTEFMAQPPVTLGFNTSGDNLVLSWPASAVGLSLYTATDPSSGTWSRVTNATTLSNDRRYVTVPRVDPPAFFQLRSN